MLAGDQVRLAPLHDVCSFLPYRGASPVGELHLAMRIGRDYTITKADRPNAWRRTAEDLGLSPGDTLERVVDLSRRLPGAMADAIDQMSGTLRASPQVALPDREVKRRSRHCVSLASQSA